MGLGCQAKVLRAIERREFRRVGGTRKIRVNFRVVAASNVSLERASPPGAFRADLYYRLKVLCSRSRRCARARRRSPCSPSGSSTTSRARRTCPPGA